MKQLFSIFFLGGTLITSQAQTDTLALEVDSIQLYIDSVELSMNYQTGVIDLPSGVATITIPAGYKYLNKDQSEDVLVNIWGNPYYEGMSEGMIFPEDAGVYSEEAIAFNIQYDEIGYVDDSDAEDIDYDELLEEMQKDSEESNKARAEQGYPAIHFEGWAAQPYYDSEHKVLHWAKNLNFEGNEYNTLNYNIRVLGRKGVLVINAISDMDNLENVKAAVPEMLDIVEFTEGYAYSDFDPEIDEVAAWTIGGLVAGKVLSKVGFLALLAKFWKVLLVGAGAAGSFIFKRFRSKKEE